MLPFNENILRMTKENADFRREVLTTCHSQVVLMSIEPNEDVGEETHWGSDQLVVCADGMGAVVVGAEMIPLHRNALVAIPAGTKHDVVNIGREPLKFYTVYTPPEMPAGTVHHTRAEALEAVPA
jgi:mannose-6-phosphate isomerase-like protein (cupin superfamily)